MTCVLLNKKNDGVDCFAFVFSRVVNQVGNVFVILNYVWWTVKTPFGEPLKKIFRGILPPLLSLGKNKTSPSSQKSLHCCCIAHCTTQIKQRDRYDGTR